MNLVGVCEDLFSVFHSICSETENHCSEGWPWLSSPGLISHYQGHVHGAVCMKGLKHREGSPLPVTWSVHYHLEKRLRAFQAKTSRLSNSFLPAGCHTAQQLLLKLSELIILQTPHPPPPSCTYAASDSIFKLPHHCVIQVCASDCLSTSILLLFFINTVFVFITFCVPVCFGGKFMFTTTASVSYCGSRKNRSDTVLTPVNNYHWVECFFVIFRQFLDTEL